MQTTLSEAPFPISKFRKPCKCYKGRHHSSLRSWIKLFNAVMASIRLSWSTSIPSPSRSSPIFTKPFILAFFALGRNAWRIRHRLLVALNGGQEGEMSSFSRRIRRALRTLRKMLSSCQSSDVLAKPDTRRQHILLGQLDIMVPFIRSGSEAVPLRDDVEKHE